MAIRSPLIPAVVIALGLLAGFVPPATAAVFFSVTPSSVSNTYNGDITLQMTGLMNQETVVVRKFLDLNANGAIDGADMLVQEFKFTDNQAGMVIGGVTNLNVPGDLNALSGVITAGRPPTRPLARAEASPASVRSRISPRSNSASAPKT